MRYQIVRDLPRLGSALALVLLVTTAFGCRDLDRTTDCDGLVCPVGRTCAPSHNMCVLTEQIDVCRDKEDGEFCRFPGINEGQCVSVISN